MIEVLVLVLLSAAAALGGTLHSRTTNINTTKTRMVQTTLWAHAPLFSGFLLAALENATLFTEIVVCAGAVLYAIGYSALSYNDSTARWPRMLILTTLGVSLFLLGTDNVHTTKTGKVSLLLVHAALYYFAVSDDFLNATVLTETGQKRPPPRLEEEARLLGAE